MITLNNLDKESKVLSAKELEPYHYYEMVNGPQAGTIVKICYRFDVISHNGIIGIVLYSPNDDRFSLLVQSVALAHSFREVELDITIDKKRV